MQEIGLAQDILMASNNVLHHNIFRASTYPMNALVPEKRKLCRSKFQVQLMRSLLANKKQRGDNCNLGSFSNV
jgi:hypothetical protein